MTEDELRQIVIEAVNPRNPNWQQSKSEPVFQVLVGAASALIECGGLLYQYQNQSDKSLTWKLDVNNLFEDFKTAVSPSGKWHVQWDNLGTNNLRNFLLWSIGFYLNKAEQNVAAALDKCTSIWLSKKLGKDINELLNKREQIYGRLRELGKKIANREEAKTMAEKLTEDDKYFYTSKANDEINKATEFFTKKVADFTLLSEAYNGLDEFNKEPAEYALIVWGRVDTFRQGIKIPEGRKRALYFIEWVITVKALIFVSDFWRQMITDIIKTPS